MSVYVSDCSEDFWMGYPTLQHQLQQFVLLPLKKQERTNKWYGNTINGPTGKGAICLGCAILLGKLTNAEKHCPMSLCTSRSCIMESHPCFQDIKCPLRHHIDVIAMEPPVPDPMVSTTNSYEYSSMVDNDVIYGTTEHINGKNSKVNFLLH
jgi:hypothetical protein